MKDSIYSKKEDRANSLKRLVRHCRMFLYACNSPVAVYNPISGDINIVALLHLTITMFITKNNSSHKEGGLFFRLLSPMHLEHLLNPVENALNRRIGKTTLREFLRQKRKKLVTYGYLDFEAQLLELQEVTHSKRAIRQFNQAFEELENAVQFLLKQLKKELHNKTSVT
ncbi:MAG TPA: hypothetical protein VMF88_15425 [Bacteroidota bacterium]|nr:hypothetical protein [Bacteroidota bacterium]